MRFYVEVGRRSGEVKVTPGWSLDSDLQISLWIQI